MLSIKPDVRNRATTSFVLLCLLVISQQSCHYVNVNTQNDGGNTSGGNIDIDSESGAETSVPKNKNSTTPVEEVDTEMLIKEFRSNLLHWHKGVNKTSPTMDSYLLQNLNNMINQLKKRSNKIPRNTLKRARVEFYYSFWQDFRVRVLEQGRVCRRASSTYQKAIENYLGFYKDKNNYEIPEEDAFILIELGHWLTNRDASAQHHGSFDGYAKAIELYEVLERASNLSNEIRYNLYVSKGITKFGQEDASAARDNFKKALALYPNSSDVYYNLGSTEAQLANYQIAIREYKKALKNENYHKLTENTVRRDAGFANILQGLKIASLKGDPSSYYQEAINYFQKVIESSNEVKLLNVSRAGQELAKYYKNPDSYTKGIKQNLNESSSMFSNYIGNNGSDSRSLIDTIKEIAFGNIVPHDQEEDPVFNIFHGKFYCSNSDQRTN